MLGQPINEESNEVIEFVPLLNHDNYEILNQYPFTIRKKINHQVVKEYIENNGYVRLNLNINGKQKKNSKHRLIAQQFIPNDDPENKTQIDHINHIKTDNRIENLRWCSSTENILNKSSQKNVRYDFIENLPEDALFVESYKSKNVVHEFENYYYFDGLFYYDNSFNYKILHINTNANGCRFVFLKDKNNYNVAVVINRFLKQHDLL